MPAGHAPQQDLFASQLSGRAIAEDLDHPLTDRRLLVVVHQRLRFDRQSGIEVFQLFGAGFQIFSFSFPSINSRDI